jgi:hypothetical protein
MLRSRVLTSIDVSRLADAVARPGIDPRTWVSYAVLTSEPYFETTAGQQDCFVNIYLMPSGVEETARVASVYAGNGFGLWMPLHKDDEVLVCAPSGDPDEGLVVTQRLWSPSDAPPQEAADNADDVVLVVEEGRSVRIGVRGGGTVRLGQVDASRGVARIDDFVNVFQKTVVVVPVVPATVPPSGTQTTTFQVFDGPADPLTGKATPGTVIYTSTTPWSGVPPLPYTTIVGGPVATASETVFSS